MQWKHGNTLLNTILSRMLSFCAYALFRKLCTPLNSEPGTPLYLMYVANNMNTERFEIASTTVEDHFYERIWAFHIVLGLDHGHEEILLLGENTSDGHQDNQRKNQRKEKGKISLFFFMFFRFQRLFEALCTAQKMKFSTKD